MRNYWEIDSGKVIFELPCSCERYGGGKEATGECPGSRSSGTWARCRKRRARGGRWSGPRLGIIGGTTISSFGRRNGGQPVPGRSSRPGGCAGVYASNIPRTCGMDECWTWRRLPVPGTARPTYDAKHLPARVEITFTISPSRRCAPMAGTRSARIQAWRRVSTGCRCPCGSAPPGTGRSRSSSRTSDRPGPANTARTSATRQRLMTFRSNPCSGCGQPRRRCRRGSGCGAASGGTPSTATAPSDTCVFDEGDAAALFGAERGLAGMDLARVFARHVQVGRLHALLAADRDDVPVRVGPGLVHQGDAAVGLGRLHAEQRLARIAPRVR